MRFEKVPYDKYREDMWKYHTHMPDLAVQRAYSKIKLPTRATAFSAAYDLRTPIDIVLPAGERRMIPTGIRAVFSEDEMEAWCLQVFVRSSIGVKDGIVLANGTGIIDADYQFAANGGDIMMPLWNPTKKMVKYKAGDRICQAVFTLHGITVDDEASGDRTGGIGSTNT